MKDKFSFGRLVGQRLTSLKLIYGVLRPRRRKQLLGLQILSLVAAVGEVANLGAILPFLRLLANPIEGFNALGPLAAPLRAMPQQNLLFGMGLGFMAVVTASTLLRMHTHRLQQRLSALITADLGEQVFGSALQKSFAWHLQHNSSSVLGHLTKDVDQAFASIQSMLIVGVNLSIVLLLGGSLIALAPVVMLVVGTIFISFYTLIFRYSRTALRSGGQKLTSNYQQSLQVAQEGIGGIRDVILDRSQEFFLESYRGYNRSYRLAQASVNIVITDPRFLIEGFLAVLIVGLSLIMSLSGQGIDRQLPLLGTLALGSYRLLQPMQQCFGAVGSILASEASLNRLRPFLFSSTTLPPLPVESALLSNESTKTPIIQLTNVSFRYNSDSPWVLKNIYLEVHKGERLAFVGSTGSGKSTTSDILLGLLAPSSGLVQIHGNDLHHIPGLVESWHRQVAHVPQQIYLSDASFTSNIAFGVPAEHIDHKQVRKAAEKARIAEMIEGSPQGYDTMVGERGVRLSGGQRQRIGIARALYRRAKLLILDEATSALDNRTEAEVMEAINDLDRTITVLLIAHRLSTVQNCDRIVVLEKGCIAGIGTYLDLVSTNATFQELAHRHGGSMS